MTNEEAKRILLSDADFSGAGEKAKVTAEALCRAIDALEKQIPQKPVIYFDGYDDSAKCPTCGSEWYPEGYLTKFCFMCGQMFDWGEEDD